MDLFTGCGLTPVTVPFRAPHTHTREHEWLAGIADKCLRPDPTEPPWKWACREVWLGGKQSATPKQYDITRTPWTKEWQELPLRRDVRVGGVMKSSRTGFTEASFNIMRWMPESWPGNVLYAINSQKLAREIVSRRIKPTLDEAAKAFLSDDPDDNTLSRISMPTMDMVFSGSGASGPFMEMWYRLIVLDEVENHIQDQETTTFDRALSRQADVPDGLTLAIAKAELAGGIIDLIFIRGTQKHYLVPCPRCGRIIQLLTDHLIADHCFEHDEWSLARVLNETFYQCQLCHQPIYESEKESMVNSDLAKWVPATPAERRRPPSGKYVPPEPGYETYQISDLYSLHERLTWGEMKKMHLMAHVINPSEEAKKYFRTNHEGLPWEGTVYSVTEESILALKAGRIEKTKIKAADGSDGIITRILSPECLLRDAKGGARQRPVFMLVYRDGKFQAPLPFKPVQITITVDKQFTFLVYVVFAWLPDGQAFFIDHGRVQDEDQLAATLRTRPYHIEGEKEPMFISAGLMDSGHRPHEVYRSCLKWWRKYQWSVWPARGEGRHEEYKGKLFRYREDNLDGQKIVVRMFYDHGIKHEFYLNQVQKRADPRLWMPDDLPASSISQLLAERYDENEKKWVHDKTRLGPNDEGDACKLQYVIKAENFEAWKKLAAS